MISPEILRRYPYFAAAGDDGLRELAMMCDEVTVSAGHVLFREGDKTDTLYILAEGEVDIQYTLGSGELRTVDTVVPGELLMWTALVEPYKSNAVVTTRQPSRLIGIDAARLRAYCEKDRAFGNDMLFHVVKLLATRLEGARVQLATVD